MSDDDADEDDSESRFSQNNALSDIKQDNATEKKCSNEKESNLQDENNMYHVDGDCGRSANDNPHGNHELELTNPSNQFSAQDTHHAIRENTFVTNDIPVGTTQQLIVTHATCETTEIQMPRNDILATPNHGSLEMRFSKHRQLDFDRIKMDLTTSRRGVLLLQTLRWVCY